MVPDYDIEVRSPKHNNELYSPSPEGICVYVEGGSMHACMHVCGGRDSLSSHQQDNWRFSMYSGNLPSAPDVSHVCKYINVCESLCVIIEIVIKGIFPLKMKIQTLFTHFNVDGGFSDIIFL